MVLLRLIWCYCVDEFTRTVPSQAPRTAPIATTNQLTPGPIYSPETSKGRAFTMSPRPKSLEAVVRSPGPAYDVRKPAGSDGPKYSMLGRKDRVDKHPSPGPGGFASPLRLRLLDPEICLQVLTTLLLRSLSRLANRWAVGTS
jgi:hypothetical protein